MYLVNFWIFIKFYFLIILLFIIFQQFINSICIYSIFLYIKIAVLPFFLNILYPTVDSSSSKNALESSIGAFWSIFTFTAFFIDSIFLISNIIDSLIPFFPILISAYSCSIFLAIVSKLLSDLRESFFIILEVLKES